MSPHSQALQSRSLQAGQVVMVDIPGPSLDAATAAHLKRYGIQAVCLFGKNMSPEPQGLRQLCADLYEVMGEHALIAIDHEGGAVVRPNFWPYAPSAMSLGAANDVQLTEEVQRAQAQQLRSVGINWNFAPVVDLNVNPYNPVIAERAFGTEAERVIGQARATLRGHTAAGIAACLKHFPGHGDTHLDTHRALPRVSKSRRELDEQELAPFQALKNEAPAIMTAHIIYDALDPQHPATLSRASLTGLLREAWGYEGVIITDSMGMQAIDAHYGRGEAAVLALRAGADLVMALGRLEVQQATLETIARDCDEAVLRPRVERLQALATRFPAPAQGAGPQQAGELFERAWARGLTGYRDPQPPPLGSRVVLLSHQQPEREFVSEAAVDAETLAQELALLYDLHLVPFSEPGEIDWTAAQALGDSTLLASTYRQRHPGLRGLQPTLHLALYNPYAVLDVDAPAVLTYGFRPEARAALWRWCRGEVSITHRWPLS